MIISYESLEQGENSVFIELKIYFTMITNVYIMLFLLKNN